MHHAITLVLLVAISTFVLAGCWDAGDPSAVSGLSTTPIAVTVEKGPIELYSGYQARRVVLDGNAVVLDTRNFNVGDNAGRVVTDVIDLGSGAVVSVPIEVTGLTVTVDAETPGKSKVTTYLRHGGMFFQSEGWSGWQPLVPGQTIDVGGHRYIQVAVELESGDDQWRPAVRRVTLNYTRRAARPFDNDLAVLAHDVQRISRSPVDFGYERMDQADLQWFRKAAGLDKVVAGKKTEFEKLAALNNWVAEQRNLRDKESKQRLGWGGWYPWDIRKVYDPTGGGAICGHCGSYAEVLITALTSMGWHARHIANSGYRANSHEVVEVWVNELGKWVYFDPSLATYYVHTETNEPLGILQMHDMFVDFFVPDGKTLADFPRKADKTQDAGYQRRLQLDYANLHARPITTDYTYGEHKPFPWKSAQGIMTCGRLQLTPRNNFHSQGEPAFKHFGNGATGADGFPVWVDAKTPLSSRASVWHSRKRDWNWTLNQASLRLIRTGADTIRVELGNSQPHFDHYAVTVNGQTRRETGPTFTWNLSDGRNELTVNCIDEFGQSGLASSVVVGKR